MSMTFQFFKNPRVLITREAYRDMMYITRAHKTEVAWFATVTRNGFADFTIDRVYLPTQHVAGTTVEIEPAHLEAVALEILDTVGEDEYVRLRCWGHSHHTMGVGASSQDDSTLREMVELANDAIVALRTNHKGEVAADIGFAEGFAVNRVEVEIEDQPYTRGDYWDAIMKDRVLPMPVQTYTGKGGSKPYGLNYYNDPDWPSGNSWSKDDSNTMSKFARAERALKRRGNITLQHARTLVNHYGFMNYWEVDEDDQAYDLWAEMVDMLDDVNRDVDDKNNLTQDAQDMLKTLYIEYEDLLDPDAWEWTDDGEEILYSSLDDEKPKNEAPKGEKKTSKKQSKRGRRKVTA